MPTIIEYNDDGTRNFIIDEDAMHAAAMLDYDGAPELEQEEFDELTNRMRAAREETEGESSSA